LTHSMLYEKSDASSLHKKDHPATDHKFFLRIAHISSIKHLGKVFEKLYIKD